MNNIIDKIVAQFAPTPAAEKPLGPADRQFRERMAAIEAYKVAKADQARRDAIEAQIAAKDRDEAAAERAEFLRKNPKATSQEIDIFQLSQALELAKRVVQRHPAKLHKTMGDGSFAPHPNVEKVRAAEAKLRYAVANYQRTQQEIKVGVTAIPAAYLTQRPK